MSSPTKSTSKRRQKKAQTNGRDRKKALAKKGTTRTETELFGNAITR
ncbi:MAG: hypothetical protein HYV07_20150 [Deltaproteobacteria bacterium]|nr:hypothetical protein [Deltaproteobacteria bacterium]